MIQIRLLACLFGRGIEEILIQGVLILSKSLYCVNNIVIFVKINILP